MFQLKFDVLTLWHGLLRETFVEKESWLLRTLFLIPILYENVIRGSTFFNQKQYETVNVSSTLHVRCINIFHSALQPFSMVNISKHPDS